MNKTSVFQTVPGRSDGVKCSVCLEKSRKYQTLQCDHTFCDSCVNNQISRLSSVRDYETVTIVCPYCRDFFYSKVAFLKTGSRRPLGQRNADFSPARSIPDFSKFTAEVAKRCQPCAEGKEFKASSFWCQTCSEFLCSLCAQYHKTMKMSKQHIVKTIQDKERYGSIKSKIHDSVAARAVPHETKSSSQSKYKCEPCNQRLARKEAKFFCGNCNEKLCEDCCRCHRSMKMSKSHKITKLPEKVRKPETGQLSEMNCERHYGEISNLFCKRCKTSCCSICAITVHSNCGSTQRLSSKTPGDTILKHSPEKKLNDNHYYFKDMAAVQSPQKKTVTYNDENVSKPTKPKETKSKIPINRMENRKSRIHFGSDVEGDWVISMALLTSGDILLVELLQPTLKMIDSMGNVVSTCTFYGDPWAVAVYNDSLAAVSFSDRQQIQLININRLGGLESGKRIATRHKSLAICFAKDLIVTSCREGCIHVMNIKGTELCSVERDNYGDRLFTNPEYIAASRQGTTIYVTDYKRDTVTALRLLPNRIDNKPEFVFTNKDLRGPKGIAVDRNDVIYISGMTSRNIFRLSPTGELIQIYRRRDDTDYYEAIAVSSSGEKLLVSAFEDNTIISMKLTK